MQRTSPCHPNWNTLALVERRLGTMQNIPTAQGGAASRGAGCFQQWVESNDQHIEEYSGKSNVQTPHTQTGEWFWLRYEKKNKIPDSLPSWSYIVLFSSFAATFTAVPNSTGRHGSVRGWSESDTDSGGIWSQECLNDVEKNIARWCQLIFGKLENDETCYINLCKLLISQFSQHGNIRLLKNVSNNNK